MGGDIKRARLWGIEKGKLPYSRVLMRLASFYSDSAEAIIEKATGQASLNLLATFLDETVPSAAAKRNKIIYVTTEEEEIVKKYLAWVRYQRKMEASVG